MRHGAQMPERRVVAELSRGLSTASVDKRPYFVHKPGQSHCPVSLAGRATNADSPVQAAFLRTAAGTGATATRSRKSLPDLKCGTYFPGTCTDSPDFGLRPKRGGR